MRLNQRRERSHHWTQVRVGPQVTRQSSRRNTPLGAGGGAREQVEVTGDVGGDVTAVVQGNGQGIVVQRTRPNLHEGRREG